MAYELMFHRRPFDGRTSESMTKSICKDPITFPGNAREKCSEQGISAIRAVSVACLFFVDEEVDCVSFGSFSRKIPRSGWVVHRTVRGRRTLRTTRGSLASIGKR